MKLSEQVRAESYPCGDPSWMPELEKLEDDLEDARIDKANAERLRDNMFAEYAELLEALELGLEMVKLCGLGGSNLPNERSFENMATGAIRKAKEHEL